MKFSTFLRFAAFGAKTILFRGKKPLLGSVIITDKRNLNCKHCSVNNLTAIVHPYEQVLREMKQLYDIDMEQTQYSKTIDKIPEPDIAISMGC